MSKHNLTIGYIGGGSRGWARTLMTDLALNDTLEGTVRLYDIDRQAADDNETIGNQIMNDHPEAAKWTYQAVGSLKEALTGVDFVIISILPGTFHEMKVDVHAPEKYGIYQAVGDTIGPGGVIRALRTIPMFEEIAKAVRDYCPNAWVINYTNPMAVCVRTLYEVFPQIKAFGCCHEVFGVQSLLARALKEKCGIETTRNEIKTHVVGVNHFTWITEASYHGMDLLPIYREYAEKHIYKPDDTLTEDNWMNRYFTSPNWVKFDLFLKTGAIGAAGDRHLSEFCPPAWYSKTPEQIESWAFHMTPVDWRFSFLADRLKETEELLNGTRSLELVKSDEEGVLQMNAISGLGDIVTNVNLPNRGQIDNLPLGAVVETNASFSSQNVRPVFSGSIPAAIYGPTAAAVAVQELSVKAGLARDLDLAFQAFYSDLHVQTLSLKDAKSLFDEMVAGTSAYLGDYLK